jgi:phosphatidylserine/phosphatidylglycerophosphate/cardiolipin synthase-like enzyme/uncharacterized membrane protein YdjX (TVP38/TMEM64 family)
MTDTILDTGRNCWRREHADRLTVLVNGAPYFAAVKRALLAARQQVFIVGWDIDSRIRLERRDPMPDVPNTLLELIDHVARARPELKIRLLIWDFTLLYAADREPLPAVKINWRTPANVTVEFDDVLPLGGAQHQKIVVVDDRLAFVGGLDLTEGRWDTAEHAENDPGRVGCDGQPYGPYHDAMAMFDGDAAAAIGELARFRWEAATGIRVPAPHRDANGDPWPDGVEPAMRNITVAIARTVPPLNGTDAIQEIQSLLLDGISAARDLIFIENQYLTARCIVDALCDRLAEKDGPEIVIVLPERYSGWLEQQTMGAGLARAADRLRGADSHGRLLLLAPRLGYHNDLRYTVHAKVMIVDDRLLQIGSANLNNRSMSVDSECDIAVEAGNDEAVARAIADFRYSLISEHCGMAADTVARETKERGSLVAALKSLDTGGRCLAPLEPEIPEPGPPDALASFADPEQPADLSEIASRITRVDLASPSFSDGLRRAWPLIGLVAAVAAVAVGWRYTPLAEMVEPKAVAGWFQSARASVFAPALAVAIYVLAGVTMFPVTVLIAATAIAFGPWLGLAYAFAGSMASALVLFGAGRYTGRGFLRRLAGKHIRTLDRYLSRSGIVTVMTVRMIPIAPFSVVNLAAGAARIRLSDFLFGTVLGMAPGIAIMTAMGDRIEALLREPDAWNTILLGALLCLWVMIGVGLQKFLRRRFNRHAQDAEREEKP